MKIYAIYFVIAGIIPAIIAKIIFPKLDDAIIALIALVGEILLIATWLWLRLTP